MGAEAGTCALSWYRPTKPGARPEKDTCPLTRIPVNGRHWYIPEKSEDCLIAGGAPRTGRPDYVKGLCRLPHYWTAMPTVLDLTLSVVRKTETAFPGVTFAGTCTFTW